MPTGGEAEPAQSLGDELTSPQPTTLLSVEAKVSLEDDSRKNATQISVYDKGIQAISLLQKVVDIAESAIPSPVGHALETLSTVLTVMKVRL